MIRLTMINIFLNKRFLTLLIVFVFGSTLLFLGLGSTGLVDETPPLFASAGRAMSQSGDWLTPKVNGILRFDKPPFFYWLMAIFYSIPANEIWDTFGSLSARLPSALSSLFLMIMIADTIFCSSDITKNKMQLSLIAALSFLLSPLIIIWSRTAVSDSLLCATIGVSLLSFWRRISSKDNQICLIPWVFLSFAILTKGPVAFVIIFTTLLTFFLTHKNWKKLVLKINPIKGLLITFIISSPWYFVQFFQNGNVFLDSFFGYHNLKRFTSIVNNHSESWWFYIFIMILASLPFSIFLFHGIFHASKELVTKFQIRSESPNSIYIFSLCWLVTVFLFFSISATKLPSYWIPAIPAASILISRSAQIISTKKANISVIWILTTFILFGISLAFYFSDSWLVLINDPEMPDLVNQIKINGLILKSKIFFTILSILSTIFIFKFLPKSLLFVQVFLFIGQFFLMPPIRKLADNLRQAPLRNISKTIINVRSSREPIAMIGIRKPSLHFYSKQIVFYESSAATGLVNLSERFNYGKRSNDLDQPNYKSDSFLIVIDKYSKEEKHWTSINSQKLGNYGIYSLLRIKREDLNLFAKKFKEDGIKPTWRNEKYERF
tara:strand:+ start:2055 stop:3875 length:1821 start_codon:yes stop_codon:yes gene_type:complete